MKSKNAEQRLLQRLSLKRGSVEYLTIRRQKRGRGFVFLDAADKPVRDALLSERFKQLVLPPAWTDVRIAIEESYHLQAVGRDAAGRLQYVYHQSWTEIRTALKRSRLERFGAALPAIRKRIASHMRGKQLDRQRVAAAALRLVDRSLLRAGHEQYAKQRGTRGVSTLLKSNVGISGDVINLDFKAKSGRDVSMEVKDGALARVLDELLKVRGQRLFKFKTDSGWHNLTAGDLNAYIKDIAGPEVSTKDFRTFGASALALRVLAGQPAPTSAHKSKKLIAGTARAVSEQLHNTPAMARTSYIHPPILEAAATEGVDKKLLSGPNRDGLDEAETGLMRFLEKKQGE